MEHKQVKDSMHVRNNLISDGVEKDLVCAGKLIFTENTVKNIFIFSSLIAIVSGTRSVLSGHGLMTSVYQNSDNLIPQPLVPLAYETIYITSSSLYFHLNINMGDYVHQLLYSKKTIMAHRLMVFWFLSPADSRLRHECDSGIHLLSLVISPNVKSR